MVMLFAEPDPSPRAPIQKNLTKELQDQESHILKGRLSGHGPPDISNFIVPHQSISMHLSIIHWASWTIFWHAVLISNQLKIQNIVPTSSSFQSLVQPLQSPYAGHHITMIAAVGPSCMRWY